MITPGEVTVQDDAAGYVAERISEELGNAISARGHASMVLAGGGTFREAYSRLASERIEWGKVKVFFGDERQVDHADPRSNYRMAADELAGLWEQKNVHPLDDSSEYDALLREYLDGNNNLFDITLLGIGPDGHTASLFPAFRDSWQDTDRLVIDTEPGHEPLVDRRTLTPRALNRSRLVLIAAAGEGKAEIVRSVVGDRETYPISAINPAGKEVLVLDSQAASLLER
jgi:6-phosphogluconolactonase